MADKTRTKHGQKGQNEVFIQKEFAASSLNSSTCSPSANVREHHFIHNNEETAGDFRPHPEANPVPISPDDSCHLNEPGELQILDKQTPLSTQWISEELLIETRKLWSKTYKRVISNEEAIEILMNVKRVAEVLIKMQKEKKSL